MLMKTKRLKSYARIPSRGSLHSSGLDLSTTEKVVILPAETALVKFAVAISIPQGYEGQIRGRSSLSKKGILCHVGTIDQDYRGELMATLTNVGNTAVVIEAGDRVAQLVIAPVEMVVCDEVDQLDVTGRGDGGFGSTGR